MSDPKLKPPPRCACARCGRFVGCGEHWGPCDHCESEGHSPEAIFCAVCAPSTRQGMDRMIRKEHDYHDFARGRCRTCDIEWKTWTAKRLEHGRYTCGDWDPRQRGLSGGPALPKNQA